jgi:hypothetical protein
MQDVREKVKQNMRGDRAKKARLSSKKCKTVRKSEAALVLVSETALLLISETALLRISEAALPKCPCPGPGTSRKPH